VSLTTFPQAKFKAKMARPIYSRTKVLGLKWGMKASYPRFERCCVSSDECHSRLEESRVSIAVT
jgi:hypothetical protein